MRPRLVENDGADLWLPDSKSGSQFDLSEVPGMIQRPYFKNLIGSNLGLGISFSGKAPALGNHVVNILSVGSKPEVFGVHADTTVATVKHQKSVRDCAMMKNPGNPVNPLGTPVDANLTIPIVLEDGPSPKPASTWNLVNTRPEAIFKCHAKIYHGLRACQSYLTNSLGLGWGGSEVLVVSSGPLY